MDEKPYIGVTELGTPEQVKKLFSAEELVASPLAPVFNETDPSKWVINPRRDQNTQSSCTYHARAKAAGVLQRNTLGEFVVYSAADYNKRWNAPAEGSSPIEAMSNWRKYGIGLEEFEPSIAISAQELALVAQNDFEKDIASVSTLDAYYGLRAYDFDQIVSTLQATNKPIVFAVFATYSEWNRDIPVIENANLPLATAPVRHLVCATPNVGVWNGQVGFTLEDSWGSIGINGAGVRWMTREFFEKRNYIQGLVPTSFKNYADIEVVPSRPTIALERDLEFGDEGPDVKALQMVYKYEGTFPANHGGSEYFGNITQRCTEQYQAKYGIVNHGTPETTGYGRVGPRTRAHINNKYKA